MGNILVETIALWLLVLSNRGLTGEASVDREDHLPASEKPVQGW